jgi:hypothetical protein
MRLALRAGAIGLAPEIPRVRNGLIGVMRWWALCVKAPDGANTNQPMAEVQRACGELHRRHGLRNQRPRALPVCPARSVRPKAAPTEPGKRFFREEKRWSCRPLALPGAGMFLALRAGAIGLAPEIPRVRNGLVCVWPSGPGEDCFGDLLKQEKSPVRQNR